MRKFDFTKGWNINLISRFALLVVTSFALLSAVAHADIVMSLNKITTENDLYTNVPNKSSVKYAINYGTVGVESPIDGVTFANQLGNGAAGYYKVYSYTDADNNKINYAYNTPQASWDSHASTGTGTAGGTYTGSGITELDKLLSSLIYSGQPANSTTLFTFGNLEAGKTYTARVLTRAWSASNNRVHTFSIDTNADGVAEEFFSNVTGTTVTGQLVSEDNPFSYAGEEYYGGAYAVDFTFTAQSNTASISLLSGPNDNQGWHNYGVMLIETNAEQVKPTTPTLYNGSFEVDNHVIVSHGGQHGYLTDSNSGIISGWEYTNLTTDNTWVGLAWVGSPCQHFLGIKRLRTDRKSCSFKALAALTLVYTKTSTVLTLMTKTRFIAFLWIWADDPEQAIRLPRYSSAKIRRLKKRISIPRQFRETVSKNTARFSFRTLTFRRLQSAIKPAATRLCWSTTFSSKRTI